MTAPRATDDSADFDESRQYPAEACTEKGFEREPGCGPQGTGIGPWAWLCAGVALFAGVAALAIPYVEWL